MSQEEIVPKTVALSTSSQPEGVPSTGAPRSTDDPPSEGAPSASTHPLDELVVGTLLDGRYVVEQKLGEGGMGVVYRGRHQVIDKRVAIKALRRSLATNSEMSERFLNEARAASSVESPHVVDISDFGRLPDGGAYFVMEFLDGTSLAQVLRKERLPSSRILHIGKQLARGLAAAHAAGIVHRDLKPDNVMVVTRGTDREFVKILDFGIAKVGGDSQLTRAGSVFGTPHYMSPEQAAGISVDWHADVYALGVMLYEMASGKVPFDADSFMAILTQHMYKPPPSFRELPAPPRDLLPGFEAVVLKCLSKRPEDRYATMDDLIADLERIERGETTLASREGARASTAETRVDYFGPQTREIVREKTASIPPELPLTTKKRTALWLVLASLAVVSVVFGVVRATSRHAASKDDVTVSTSATSVQPASSLPASSNGATEARKSAVDVSAPEVPVAKASSAPDVGGAPTAEKQPFVEAPVASAPVAKEPAKPVSVKSGSRSKDAHATPKAPSVVVKTEDPPKASPPPAPRPQTRPPSCAIEDWDPFEHKCAR